MESILNSLLHSPVFYKLDAVDLVVLSSIGVFWSAALYFMTEQLKERAGWVKPYSQFQRNFLTWGPIVVSVGIVTSLMPTMLEGVGQPADFSLPLTAISGLLGLLAGVAAKVGHDFARKILSAISTKIVERIRGTSTKK